MKIRVGILIFTFFALLAWAYSASASDDFLKKAAGHYEGTLTSHIGETFTQTLVRSDLSSDKNAMKTITVTDEDKKDVFVLHLDKIGNNDLLISGPLDSQVKLKRNKGDSCFLIQEPQSVALCFYRDLITVDISDKDKKPQFSLSLNNFVKEKPTVQEVPKVYDLPTAIGIALKRNFDNRIEFENVMQAKFKKKAAKGNLLPHISFSTIVNNVKPTLLSVIGSAGDLAPFLFPTRWMALKQAGQLSEAEQDTMTLLRLDTATQVEALFYNYENDRTIRDSYGNFLAKAQIVRGEVNMREKNLGTIPDGSTDEVDSIINFVQQDYVAMEATLGEDRSAIALVMGLNNPEAVKDIKLDPEPVPITRAQPLDVVKLTELAVARSIELRQVDFLIAAAAANKKSVTWNWLDPQGDPTLELGAGSKPNIEVASSQIIQFKIIREQLKQKTINQKVNSAVKDYNQALKTYVAAAEGQQIQDRRLETVDKLLNLTGKVDNLGLALVQKFQDYMTAQVNAQVINFTYRVARSRIDRLLLQGYYVDETKPPQINRQP